MTTMTMFGEFDYCVICRAKIPSGLSWAHLHGNHRTRQGRREVRLCWYCHRLYDHDILTTEEILAAHEATYGVAWQPVDVNALHRAWEADLDAGRRRVNKQRQHGRSFAQSSANAKRAWETIWARRKAQ
jgi:hypothetical protein